MMPVFFLKKRLFFENFRKKPVELDIYHAHITEKISSFGFKIIVFFSFIFLNYFFFEFPVFFH